jgi:hypothetical protein
MKVGDVTLTQPLNVLIDPRVAQDGVTVADLVEQFEHSLRMLEMVEGVNQLVSRVRDAQTRLEGATGAAADTLQAVEAIAARLLTAPVRYAKPGLQAHISYLNRLSNRAEQKIGRDVLERYESLNRELAAIRDEVNRVLGSGR